MRTNGNYWFRSNENDEILLKEIVIYIREVFIKFITLLIVLGMTSLSMFMDFNFSGFHNYYNIDFFCNVKTRLA